MARDPMDAYYTPVAVAEAAIAWAAALAPPGWAPAWSWEPCAGGGAFSDAIRARWPGLAEAQHVSDPDPRAPAMGRPDLVQVAPARVEDPGPVAVFGWDRAGLIATNPHYTGLVASVGHLRRHQQQEGLRRAPLLLLVRETVVSHLLAGLPAEDRPRALGLCPRRPIWGGPGGDALLAAARERATAAGAERRARRIAELQAELGDVKVKEGRRSALQARIAALEGHESRISHAPSDSCGSALLLWPSVSAGPWRGPTEVHPWTWGPAGAPEGEGEE